MEENTSNPATESTGTEPTEGGENPTLSYADGKFTNVGDLEKSYLELQSTFSKKLGGFEGAPEEYSFSHEGFEANETSEALTAWGKEHQLSNDGINSLYGALSELDAKRNEAQTESEKAYVKEQTEALGTNADSRIKNASDWVRANIGEEAADSINQMWGGAKGVEAIEKIMKMSQGAVPTTAPAQEHITIEKVNAMQFAKDDYGNLKMDNPKYAAKVRELRASLMR